MRRLTGDDWAAYRAFRIAGIREAPEAFGSTLADTLERSDGSWRDLLDALCDPEGIGLVAIDDDGTWLATMRANVRGHDAWIYGVYVAPQARRAGLASTMLVAVVDWARPFADTAMLHVADGNTRARRLYEGLGFAPTGVTEDNPAHASITEIEMRLPLHP